MFLNWIVCSERSYNPRIPGPPAGWQVPPRPQPWYPQHPAVSAPPPGQAGLPPQPLFPVHNIRPSAAPPVIQPSLSVTPPGMPATTPIPVSQPLFPVVPSNNIPQSSPFSAPMPSLSLPLRSSLEMTSAPQFGSTLPINSYLTSGIPGLCFPFNLYFPCNGMMSSLLSDSDISLLFLIT